METADSRQQTADSRQQTADSRQQTADSRQQTADKFFRLFTEGNTCPENSRIIYADLLRIVASFSVIMIHVSVGQAARTDILGSFSWYVNLLFWTISWYAVPVFFMISGMFNLKSEYTCFGEEINRTLKKSLKIISALVFWYIVDCTYISIGKLIIKGEAIAIHDVLKIPYIILSDEKGNHLWYLYTLIGLYLFTPVLKIFVTNAKKKDIEYFLFLYMIFGICVPFYNKISGQLNNLIPYFPNAIAFSLSPVAGYIGYYIAGYYFSKYQINMRIKIGIYFMACISMIISITGTAIISIHYGHFDYILCNHNGPFMLFISWGIFLFFKDIFEGSKFSEKQLNVINNISKCTFGIYLVHLFVLVIFNYMGITSTLFYPIVSVPCITLLIMVCSYIVTIIIKRIPILKGSIV